MKQIDVTGNERGKRGFRRGNDLRVEEREEYNDNERKEMKKEEMMISVKRN